MGSVVGFLLLSRIEPYAFGSRCCDRMYLAVDLDFSDDAAQTEPVSVTTSVLWEMACGRIPPPDHQQGLLHMRTATAYMEPITMPRAWSTTVVHDVLNRNSPYLGYCSSCHRRKIGFGNGIGYCPSSICRRASKQRQADRASPAIASSTTVHSGGAYACKRTRTK